MKKSQIVQYFAEGDDEVKLIKVLKAEKKIVAGKVQKLNVVEQFISNARLMQLQFNTKVVLIFDTDTGQTETLNANIERLKKCKTVSEIITIPQVQNLEDELIRSCDIRAIKELLGSKSNDDFKSDLLQVTNLFGKLQEHNFNLDTFWNSNPSSPYELISNMSYKIKF